MADSELPVVLQPCNSWKVPCVSDSPAGLGSPGPAGTSAALTLQAAGPAGATG